MDRDQGKTEYQRTVDRIASGTEEPLRVLEGRVPPKLPPKTIPPIVSLQNSCGVKVTVVHLMEPFFIIIITKVFRTQDGVSISQSGSPTTRVAQISQKMSKLTQETALSDRVGDPTAVTLAINHSIFIK